MFKSEKRNEVPKESLKKAGLCWAPWPMPEKARGSPFTTVLGQKVNAQGSIGGGGGVLHKGISQNQGHLQPKSKAMVVQICFKNQDNSLSNMKFNEEEHNLQVIKNKKNQEIKIKTFTA